MWPSFSNMWTWPFGSPDFRVLAHWAGGTSQRSHRKLLSGPIQRTGPSLSTLPVHSSNVLGTIDGRVGPLGGCSCYGGALPGSLFPSFWISQAMAGEASANRGLDSAMPQWTHSSHFTKVFTSAFPSPSQFLLSTA